MTGLMRSSGKTADRIRLGAIAFINTVPVYAGFEPDGDTDLVYDVPAALNRRMADGELHISPVSSAWYLRNRDRVVLLDDLSVSSPGAVESVIFLSRRPLDRSLLEQVAIAVPDDSETSIALLQWLIHQRTGEPLAGFADRFVTYPAADYRRALAETGSALVIGDNALLIHERGIPDGVYCYDLAGLWHEVTGLPFVFAVWVADRVWAERFPGRLETVRSSLVAARQRFFEDPALFDEGVRLAEARCTIPTEAIRRYFTRCLDYRLADSHRQSLALFAQVPGMPDNHLEQSARETTVERHVIA